MKYAFYTLLFALFTLSCQTEQKQELDSAYKGSIRVMADEAFAHVVRQHALAYVNEYKGTAIEVQSGQEADCFASLLNDSSRLILVSRKPNASDLADYKTKTLVPVVKEAAINGVAVIVSKNNPRENIRTSEITQLIAGKAVDSTLLVFDNSRSGMFVYMLEKTGVTTPSARVFSVKSSEDLIDYVAKHDNCIGLADFSLFSDRDDPSARERLTQVKILAVAADTIIGTELVYVKPSITSFAKGTYPLSRNIYAITLEQYSGLGNAFLGYMLNDKGQAIFRMAGLSPYYIKGIVKQVYSE